MQIKVLTHFILLFSTQALHSAVEKLRDGKWNEEERVSELVRSTEIENGHEKAESKVEKDEEQEQVNSSEKAKKKSSTSSFKWSQAKQSSGKKSLKKWALQTRWKACVSFSQFFF